MFETLEETSVVRDEEERTSLEEPINSKTISSASDAIPSNYQWEGIRKELRGITIELEMLEGYFMKAACSVDIGDFKNSERQKLLDLYKELNKLAQVLRTGYSGQELVSRKDFEDELKTFKNDFKFMLRKLPPSSRMFSDSPELISEQLTVTADVVRDVKRILTAHFSRHHCWRDILEQVAAIILFVSDILSDWVAVVFHFDAPRGDSWSSLVTSVLTVVFIHFAAFRTACTYVSSKLLIPLYTLLPILPLQVMTRQLHTSFKFKRKPDDIQFEEMIHYHSTQEDLVFIHSSQVLLGAFPQLILQGCVLLGILFHPTNAHVRWAQLIFSWVTSLLDLCYACSRRFSFEFSNSIRFVPIPDFIFFLFYELSRVASSIMLFVFTPWWFCMFVCLLRFHMSLVWLCRRINSSYNIHASIIRRVASSFKGSVILTSIPILCYWSEFPQFWINALDVFGCLTLSVVWASPVLGQHYNKAVSLVISVIMSWLITCTMAWNSASLSRIFFGSSFEGR